MYPVSGEIKISSCSLVLKLIQGTLPNYLNEHFTVNNRVHTRNTKYTNFNVVFPKHVGETESGKSFLVRSRKFWNSFPLEIKHKDSSPAFKKCLWNVLFKEQLN